MKTLFFRFVLPAVIGLLSLGAGGGAAQAALLQMDTGKVWYHYFWSCQGSYPCLPDPYFVAFESSFKLDTETARIFDATVNGEPTADGVGWGVGCHSRCNYYSVDRQSALKYGAHLTIGPYAVDTTLSHLRSLAASMTPGETVAKCTRFVIRGREAYDDVPARTYGRGCDTGDPAQVPELTHSFNITHLGESPATVPLPASLPLAAAGLGLLGGLARLRRR